jgi:SAGA-associated factor 73
VPSALFLAVHFLTTCCLRPIRRRIKLSNKVPVAPHFQQCSTNKETEAAIDANAPLEDEEEANGPFDSDEELQGVMTGLANWNPQPLVQPELQIPIQRKYQKEALYEQLRQATNGFTVNIFAVKGFGAQKLQPGHPGLLNLNGDGDADADGEADGVYGLASGMQGVANRRAGSFNMQLPASRRASMASQASQR